MQAEKKIIFWYCFVGRVCVTVYSTINQDSLEVNLFLMKAKEFNKGHPFSRDPKATHEFLSICCS